MQKIYFHWFELRYFEKSVLLFWNQLVLTEHKAAATVEDWPIECNLITGEKNSNLITQSVTVSKQTVTAQKAQH